MLKPSESTMRRCRIRRRRTGTGPSWISSAYVPIAIDWPIGKYARQMLLELKRDRRFTAGSSPNPCSSELDLGRTYPSTTGLSIDPRGLKMRSAIQDNGRRSSAMPRWISARLVRFPVPLAPGSLPVAAAALRSRLGSCSASSWPNMRKGNDNQCGSDGAHPTKDAGSLY